MGRNESPAFHFYPEGVGICDFNVQYFPEECDKP